MHLITSTFVVYFDCTLHFSCFILQYTLVYVFNYLHFHCFILHYALLLTKFPSGLFPVYFLSYSISSHKISVDFLNVWAIYHGLSIHACVHFLSTLPWQSCNNDFHPQDPLLHLVMSDPAIQSTPVKHGTSTLFRFITNHKYRQKEMTNMGNEMKGYLVGPMPAIQFLNNLFPQDILQNGLKAQWYQTVCFKNVFSCISETWAYEPFVSLFTTIMQYSLIWMLS